MAGNENLKATDTAAAEVKSVISYQHGAPTSTDMAQVSGVAEWPASNYSGKLGSLGGELEAEFQKLLKLVVEDCKKSELSIQQMQDLDGEIAGVLRSMSVEPGTDSPSNGGGSDATW